MDNNITKTLCTNKEIKNVQILEQVLTNFEGDPVGKIAILVTNSFNAKSKLDDAVISYVGEVPCIQFVDIKMNNPWVRIVSSGLDKLDFIDFEEFLKDRDSYRIKKERNITINKILK